MGNLVCEKCGKTMERMVKGSSRGWECAACGWSVVTTHIEEIHSDDTEYSIFVKRVSGAGENAIRAVAKTAGVNYIAARKMLENGVCVLKAKAVEIRIAISRLQEAGIELEVRPKYRY